MRASLYDVPVNFRASPALVEAAKEAARKRGVTFSELMRHQMLNLREKEAA